MGYISFFKKYLFDILIITLIVFGVILAIQWVCWIFRRGRYEHDNNPKRGGIMYLLADFLVKVIIDFRNFLALVLIVIFAVSLSYALYKAGNKIEDLSKALQAVMSTLGGLVGSIVGYYFGESAARSANSISKNSITSESAREQIQGDHIEQVSPPDANSG